MTPTLAAALKYAKLGWAVLPLYGLKQGACLCGDASCRSPGKHPHRELVPHGVHDASKDAKRITEWFTRVPSANVGIATGAASGFVVLDIDPRNGSDDTLAELQKQHGKIPDTATQLTGGGGYHYLFAYDGQRLRSPGRGLDVKGDGGYIVAEPSTHVSGGSYAWEGSADPTEGHPLADPPAWMIAPAIDRATGPSVAGTGYLDAQRLSDLKAALQHIDPNPYQTWIAVGQALHSTEAPEAFEAWDEWSQRADSYDGSTAKKWATFKANGPLHVESIFVWARDAGWDGSAPQIAKPASTVVAFKPPEIGMVPSELLRLPGALGTFVDLCNRTAPKPQPQFAVQAALAFASVVMGRRYCTTMNNWPGLYFVNVGKSASGKEHARTVMDTVLTAAGLGQLFGPSGYTSDSAVFSALYHQPTHLAIIDELGSLLCNSKAQGNFHKRGALTALTELWGLMGGSMRPQGYSTMGLRPDQRSEMAARVVHRPSLTLLGMTTPKTFYDSLTEASIEGGFLNRLIIVESTIGRQLSRECDPIEVPDSLVEWCRAVREGQGGNLSGFDMAPDAMPVPRIVGFTNDAKGAFREYEIECNASMDELEAEGLGEMQGRSREKALRISQGLAVSDNVAHPVITLEHARWAIAYVRYYTTQTIEAIRTHLTGSQFGQWRAATLDALRRSGERGLTVRELCRNCRPFAGLEPRQRDQVLKGLTDESLAAKVDFGKGPSGRGRPRVAWIAIEEQEDAA
ncbi:MAG: bifunctional DNA primase/polymerase [Cypionkella sp.]